MKKKLYIILYVIVLIVLSSFVYGIDRNVSNYVFFEGMNESSYHSINGTIPLNGTNLTSGGWGTGTGVCEDGHCEYNASIIYDSNDISMRMSYFGDVANGQTILINISEDYYILNGTIELKFYDNGTNITTFYFYVHPSDTGFYDPGEAIGISADNDDYYVYTSSGSASNSAVDRARQSWVNMSWYYNDEVRQIEASINNVNIYNYTGVENGFDWMKINTPSGGSVYFTDIFAKNNTPSNVTIDNCSLDVDSVNTLNFSFLNISDNTSATGELNFLFVYNFSGITKNYSLSRTASNASFCIYPPKATATSSILVDYTIAGTTYEYNNPSINLNNVNQIINLYTQEGTTQISLTVVDENDETISDAYVHVYRFDVGENQYYKTEVVKTDSEGVALANVILNTEWYKFEVEYLGSIVYTEDRRKLTETSYTLRVNLGTVPEPIAEKLYTLDIDLNGNNDAKWFQVNWSSVSSVISEINFTVTKSNVTIDFVIYSNSSTLDDGTFSYYLPSPYSTTGHYIGNVYGKSTDDGLNYLIKSATIDIREEWDLFGTESLLMVFIFVGTMTMIGVAVSAELGILLTVMGMIIFWILGFYALALSGLMSLVTCLIVILARVRRR
jgi:hypothetical protein